MRARLAAHRDRAAATVGNVPTGRNVVAVLDGLLTLLLAGGPLRQSAVHAADLIPQFVSASIYKASMFQQRVEREPAYFAQLDRSMAALPRARFPAIAELLLELTATEAPDARTRGLDVLVCGLAALAPPAPTPRHPPPRRR